MPTVVGAGQPGDGGDTALSLRSVSCARVSTPRMVSAVRLAPTERTQAAA
ncbi:hypothetical protein [Streptomyces sp. NPDC058291]